MKKKIVTFKEFKQNFNKEIKKVLFRVIKETEKWEPFLSKCTFNNKRNVSFNEYLEELFWGVMHNLSIGNFPIIFVALNLNKGCHVQKALYDLPKVTEMVIVNLLVGIYEVEEFQVIIQKIDKILCPSLFKRFLLKFK